MLLTPEICQDAVASERFTRKVEVAASGCSLWKAAKNRDGYGQFHLVGATWYAHRIAWIAATGEPVPTGMHLDHYACNDRSCVEVGHLRIVTPRENILRGNAPSARRRAWTHCLQGHLLGDDNVHPSVARKGDRTCRTCDRESSRRQGRLIRDAHMGLGMTQKEYVATYGRSPEIAQFICDAVNNRE